MYLINGPAYDDDRTCRSCMRFEHSRSWRTFFFVNVSGIHHKTIFCIFKVQNIWYADPKNVAKPFGPRPINWVRWACIRRTASFQRPCAPGEDQGRWSFTSRPFKFVEKENELLRPRFILVMVGWSRCVHYSIAIISIKARWTRSISPCPIAILVVKRSDCVFLVFFNKITKSRFGQVVRPASINCGWSGR